MLTTPILILLVVLGLVTVGIAKAGQPLPFLMFCVGCGVLLDGFAVGQLLGVFFIITVVGAVLMLLSLLLRG